ncbi:PP2C family protein-serine/threonine phosphatase [Planctomicrobium piriforme]|uniref:Serine phosphatase RsbU, regulator of sigma subunit n=1 Tax=Planctomicrobium piriforme TaxID=1576369 RepID=A0A1I3FDB4_9PLAN|nr:PP2C family protein-serine/threonine phosphatase [Planctomicrobium piriforme]SFI09223.1 Serine phosphatase RsbU, regulator of sigma subunit [Planctomicrobium piriforme]
MKILVGWDDPAQAELLRLYLAVDDAGVVITTSTQSLLTLVKSSQTWDCIVVTTAFPDHDAAFGIFETIRDLRPNCPLVAACHQSDVYRLARYLTNGLRAYVIRDPAGDYMFLMHAVVVGAVQQVQAEHERLIAEKLRREVDSVRQLQESIIPQQINTPAGYGIVARYESSQIRVIGGQPVTMAGGDYYDAFTLPDDSMIFLVGDASGHGMKACMSIMTMHTLIRMIRYDEYREPAHFVQFINQQLCQQSVVSAEGGFITLLYGVLNHKTHELRWASAGHQPPVLHQMEQNTVETIAGDDAAGLPIGIYQDAEYETHSYTIPPASRLVLYTDGLTEAFPGGEVHSEFGMTGLVNTLRKNRTNPVAKCMQSLFDDSHAFTQGQGRHDDTSVLIVERSC